MQKEKCNIKCSTILSIKSALIGFVLLFLCVGLCSCDKNELSVSTAGNDSKVSSGEPGDNDSETDSKSAEGKSQSESEASTQSESETKDSAVKESEQSLQYINVYVCGAVNSEGVYSLKEGSIVRDALDMAGGYSENAYRGYVNLAARLEDGQQIYIPSVEEAENKGLEINGSADSGSDIVDTGGGQSSSQLVNINNADAETLKTLPGIGDSKAADIINYREQSGPFKSIQDIKNVSGIGESTFNKLSPYITVD